MNDQTFLTHHFLIAMPSLEDAFFRHSVTYICEHNANGAMGLVINRPLTINLDEVLSQMGIANNNPLSNQLPVLFGGPLHQERGFVVHRPLGHWRSTYRVAEDIGVTTSRDILEAIAVGSGPGEIMVSLGCAGWQPGQLEQEMASNNWLSTPADTKILFETPYEERWQSAAALLGIDINTLSSDTGHA